MLPCNTCRTNSASSIRLTPGRCNYLPASAIPQNSKSANGVTAACVRFRRAWRQHGPGDGSAGDGISCLHLARTENRESYYKKMGQCLLIPSAPRRHGCSMSFLTKQLLLSAPLARRASEGNCNIEAMHPRWRVGLTAQTAVRPVVALRHLRPHVARL